MSRFVIVTGLPASGKSTVAREIADALGLERLDKDDFLEALFDADPASARDPTWRRRLSREADRQFADRARQSDGAVLASWWRHPRSATESGTPIEWLNSLRGPCVEVHCVCRPSVACDRFLSRRRHPGHLDGRWSRDALLASLQEHSALPRAMRAGP